MTSPIEEITIKCPVCKQVFQDWYRGSINLMMDPWATEEYIQQAQSATCPQCGHVVDLGGMTVSEDGTTWTITENVLFP
jgi:hypothetical protein